MSEASELQKVEETLNYFKRYYEFDIAIKTHKENENYLRTLIHDKYYVQNRFELHKKYKRVNLIAAAAALIAAVVAVIVVGFDNFGPINFIAGAAAAVVFFFAVFFIGRSYLNKKVEAKWKEQREVNDGITAQLGDVEQRISNLERQKRDFLPALDEKRLVVIPTKYIIEADKIAQFVRDGKAATGQQAVEMYEEEQLRLKEKALEERRRKDEEARERARKLEMQREERRRRLEEEERAREAAEEAARREEDRAKREEYDRAAKIEWERQRAETIRLRKEKEEAEALAAEAAEALAAETAEPEEEKFEFRLASGGSSSKKSSKKEERKITGKSAEKPTEKKPSSNSGKRELSADAQAEEHRAYKEPSFAVVGESVGSVKLVEEPEEPEERAAAKDEETKNLESRMNSILSMSKSNNVKHKSGKAAFDIKKAEERAAKDPIPVSGRPQDNSPEFGGLSMKKNGKK